MNGEAKVELTTDQLNEVLYHLEDILGRALLPFVLLKETARSIIQDNALKGDSLIVGVKAAELTEDAKSTLRTLASDTYDLRMGMDNFTETETSISWTHKGIPVEIQIIKRDYNFFRNPDFTFYMGEQYSVPNPFDKYYKGRFLIK